MNEIFKSLGIGGGFAFLVMSWVWFFAGASPLGLDQRVTALEQRPMVLAAAIAPPIVQPRVLSYSEWRAQTPVSIYTEEEIRVALIEAGFSPSRAASLASAWVNCEAPVLDRDGVSIGAKRDARGDSGKAKGPGAINVEWNPWADAYYLDDLGVTASVAFRVASEGGPWYCER